MALVRSPTLARVLVVMGELQLDRHRHHQVLAPDLDHQRASAERLAVVIPHEETSLDRDCSCEAFGMDPCSAP